jgi:translation initiation factor 2B subunit (eIF-2B alpha/beta/delta family)
MNQALRAALDALAADSHSGASELLPRAIDVLRAAREQGTETLAKVARGVVAAQPSMGPFWNAAAAALADAANPGALERFEQRWRRAGPALRRVAVEALAPPDRGPLHLMTCSFSGSVLAALTGLAAEASLTVSCAEGRPRYEGRRLAGALAAAGVGVEYFSDAALGCALETTAAFLTGADAITPAWFLNKVGTSQLAAAASLKGIPVFVLATRDKFVPPQLSDLLSIRNHDPSEVWDGAPAGVTVRNLYFERVPLDLVSAVITDAGLLGADMAAEVCRANGAGLTAETVDTLCRAM